MTEAYRTPEKLEAFVKEYRASKSQGWTCDQIERVKKKSMAEIWTNQTKFHS